jgi:hypothetical protein
MDKYIDFFRSKCKMSSIDSLNNLGISGLIARPIDPVFKYAEHYNLFVTLTHPENADPSINFVGSSIPVTVP